jgi:hypothetical protein
MLREYKIKLFSTFKQKFPKMSFVQNDTESSRITFELYDDVNVPMANIQVAGATVERPDGKTFTYGNEEFVINENLVTFIPPVSALNVPGTCSAQVNVYYLEGENERRLSTPVFTFEVSGELIGEPPIESDEQYPVLTQLINDTKEIKDLTESRYAEALAMSVENNNLELVDARKGETSLGVKIGKIDSAMADIVTYSVESFSQYCQTINGQLDYSGALEEIKNRLNKDHTGIILLSNKDYYFNKGVKFEGLNNIIISGSKARLIKTMRNFPNENYLMQFNQCNNVKVENLQVEGFDSNVFENWGDDGIVFNQCNKVEIASCHFKNLGDSALRNTNYDNTGDDTVNYSMYNVHDCIFENIQQTSITPGGYKLINWTGNTSIDIVGSHKFSSNRLKGGKLVIANNRVKGRDDKITYSRGYEINHLEDVIIANNIIDNVREGIFVYNGGETGNTDARKSMLIDFIMSGNIFKNIYRNAIYIASADSVVATAGILNISAIGNIFNNIATENAADTNNASNCCVFMTSTNLIKNVIVSDNIVNVCNGSFVRMESKDIVNITLEGNTIDELTQGKFIAFGHKGINSTVDGVNIKNNYVKSCIIIMMTNPNGYTGTVIKNVTMTGNFFISRDFGAVSTATATDLKISDNYFKSTRTSGTGWLYNAFLNSIIKDNLFICDNTTEYMIGGTYTGTLFIGNKVLGGYSPSLQASLVTNVSSASTVDALKTDFNNLINKLKDLKILV